MEEFFAKNREVFQHFFRFYSRQQDDIGSPEQNRQQERADYGEIQPDAQRRGDGHEYSQLPLAAAHAEQEERGEAAETVEQVEAPGAPRERAPHGAQQVVEKPQQSAEAERRAELHELHKRRQLHQWKSLAQRLRLGATSS